MRKLILLSMIIFCSLSYGQSFVVTPLGLRDAKDLEKTYVVITVDSMTAKQLYDNAIKYINVNYKNPDYVIKGKTVNEFLKFDTRGINICLLGKSFLVDGKYTTQLYFKDGKIKYEIIDLEMYSTDRYGSGGSPLRFISSTWFKGIYNKEGILKEERGKGMIETYFNSELDVITKFLKGKNEIDNKNW